MNRLALARILGALAAAVLVSPAGAQLYKWVDDKGVTNYGSTPPANARNLQKLDDSNPRVSTVPGLKPEEVQAGENRALQQKVDQLERDLEAQRRATADAQARAAADAQWRELPGRPARRLRRPVTRGVGLRHRRHVVSVLPAGGAAAAAAQAAGPARGPQADAAVTGIRLSSGARGRA